MQFKSDFAPAYRKWVGKQPTRPQRAVVAARETRRIEEVTLLYAVLLVLLLEALAMAVLMVLMVSTH